MEFGNAESGAVESESAALGEAERQLQQEELDATIKVGRGDVMVCHSTAVAPRARVTHELILASLSVQTLQGTGVGDVMDAQHWALAYYFTPEAAQYDMRLAIRSPTTQPCNGIPRPPVDSRRPARSPSSLLRMQSNDAFMDQDSQRVWDRTFMHSPAAATALSAESSVACSTSATVTAPVDSSAIGVRSRPPTSSSEPVPDAPAAPEPAPAPAPAPAPDTAAAALVALRTKKTHRAEKKARGQEKATLADRTSFAMMRAASQAEAKQLTEPHQGRENFGAAGDAIGRGARVLPDQRSFVEIEESDQLTTTLLVECPARMLKHGGSVNTYTTVFV